LIDFWKKKRGPLYEGIGTEGAEEMEGVPKKRESLYEKILRVVLFFTHERTWTKVMRAGA